MTAYFAWPKSETDTWIVVSNTLQLRIANPQSIDEERDALDLFRWDVGAYLAMGGSDALPEAQAILEQIAERREAMAKRAEETIEDPLLVNIRRCFAINSLRDFVMYSKGKFRTRKAKTDDAIGYLRSIEASLDRVYDEVTCKQTRKMLSDLTDDKAKIKADSFVESKGK